MGKAVVPLTVAATVLAGAVALGATAIFTPVGPTTVTPGTEVRLTVSVSVESLNGFDAADILIGSDGATDLDFVYSESWQTAFDNVTPPSADNGLYAQDVFVGGNNPSPVGSSLLLGTVVVDTTGMGEGTFEVRIDPAIVLEVSSLILSGTHEGLLGSAPFTIQCARLFDTSQCDGDIDLGDYAALSSCLTGPGQDVAGTCGRFDATGDGRVDLADVRVFLTEFTGSF